MAFNTICRDYLLNLAVSYNGHLEIGNTNRSDIIDIIQKEFNTRGQQYCAMFVWYIYQQTFLLCGFNNPLPKTASSQTMFTELKKYYPNAVYTSYDNRHQIQPGDIVIWRKFKLWQGHAGICLENNITRDNSILTIEANTTSQMHLNNSTETQRNGNGIFIRKRSVNKIDFTPDSFYYRGFISFQKLYTAVANNHLSQMSLSSHQSLNNSDDIQARSLSDALKSSKGTPASSSIKAAGIEA